VRGELGNTIAVFEMYGCENGVKVVLEVGRKGWRKLLGSVKLEFVAMNMPDLVMVFEKILGNEKVASELERYFGKPQIVVN
jgi:hypothetical protein